MIFRRLNSFFVFFHSSLYTLSGNGHHIHRTMFYRGKKARGDIIYKVSIIHEGRPKSLTHFLAISGSIKYGARLSFALQ